MKKFLSIAVISFLFILSNMAYAGQGELGMALKAGTLGAGIEGTVGLTETLNTRLGFNYFSMEHDLTESNVDYEFDLDLMSISLLVDWHPLNNGFRFTAGAMYNGNEVDATGKPTGGSYSINNTTYTAAEVGTLTGRIDFDDFAPYFGVGYGNAVGKNKKWNFVFDLGLMYQGSPNVSFAANGTSSGLAAFQSELEAERRQLEEELDDFSFYPVISFGISYKF